MIIAERVYAVLMVIVIILITVFYLIYLGRYSKENVIYIQGNSKYALPITSNYRNMNVFDTNSLTYDINISRVYLDSYDGYTRTGRFIMYFSQIGDINFTVVDNNRNSLSNYKTQELRMYYPIYVNFKAPKTATYIDLQYSTASANVVLYKLSVEFF